MDWMLEREGEGTDERSSSSSSSFPFQAKMREGKKREKGLKNVTRRGIEVEEREKVCVCVHVSLSFFLGSFPAVPAAAAFHSLYSMEYISKRRREEGKLEESGVGISSFSLSFLSMQEEVLYRTYWYCCYCSSPLLPSPARRLFRFSSLFSNTTHPFLCL